MTTDFRNYPTDSQRTSRRAVLSQPSAVVGGTALSSAIARTAHAAGDETIKVALVGCGARGAGTASQALKTKGPVKLWAMADLFEVRLQTSLGTPRQGPTGRLRLA